MSYLLDMMAEAVVISQCMLPLAVLNLAEQPTRGTADCRHSCRSTVFVLLGAGLVRREVRQNDEASAVELLLDTW